MRNAEVLDTMGMTKGLIRRWQRSSSSVLRLQTEASDHAASIMSLSKFLRLVIQVVVLGVGAWLVLRREMTAGQMIAASIIMSRALAPVEQSIGTWRQTISALDSYKRLSEMFSRPLLRADSMQLPKPTGLLTVEGVSYVPNGARAPIIRGVSCVLKPATVTAVVGPSAAGKSTLARLCVGAYAPTYGNVRLDGADIYLWERADFGQYVGYLPQDVELFAGTVRDNIARFNEADPAEVVEAARLAGAHEMILRLAQGYETEIGEAGGLLSGGQRQRLGLARALFRKPQLIVLDEPNSSLDGEGEEALNTAIGCLKQLGCTVLVVGHRPSILQFVDNLIVLRDGKIEMAGAKEEILPRIMQGRKAAAVQPPQVQSGTGIPS
jgi:ATP-binding cassette subfamily C protein/ATP-binding cassette subfamily C protein EexD